MPTSSERRAVVQRGEDGRWFARPYMGTDRVTGRRIRPYRSWDAGLSREQAQAECDRWAATFDPSSARDSSKRLSSMLETYISDPVNGLSDNSVATYSSVVRTMVEPTIGRLPYDQLEPWDVSAAYRMLLAPRSGKGLSPKTLLKMHALLKGASRSWRAALGRDIMLDVPAPSPDPVEPFALSELDTDELSRALASAMSSRSASAANISRRTDAQRMAITMIMPVLENSRARAEAGRKGGLSRGSAASGAASKTESKSASKTESKSASKTESKRASEEEEEGEEELGVWINPSDCENEGGGGAEFVPPTLEEVEAYFAANCLCGSASKFFDYYESNGWTRQGFPIAKWEPVARIWSDRERGYDAARKARGGQTSQEVERAAVWKPAETEDDVIAALERELGESA